MSPWTNPDQSYTSVITILCKWNDAYIALFYSWAQSALYNTHTLFSIFFYLSAFYLIFTLQRATQVQGSCPSKLWHTDCSSRGSNRQTFDLQMICCFSSRSTSQHLYVGMLIWSLQQHFKSDEEDKDKHRQSTEHRPVCILSKTSQSSACTASHLLLSKYLCAISGSNRLQQAKMNSFDSNNH